MSIKNRLKKLEKQQPPRPLRVVWVGRGEDGDAKVADLIASGHARAGDEFMLVTWDWDGVGGAPGKQSSGKTKWPATGKRRYGPVG
jgi:hypothetical protein